MYPMQQSKFPRWLAIPLIMVLMAAAWFYGMKDGYQKGMQDAGHVDHAVRTTTLSAWLNLLEDQKLDLLRWSLETEQDILVWQMLQSSDENHYWMSADPRMSPDAMRRNVDIALRQLADYRHKHPRADVDNSGTYHNKVPLPDLQRAVDSALSKASPTP